MKTRKMWAVSNWPDRRWVECSEHTAVGRVPVLVTSLEGAPDFEPGDRVRVGELMDGEVVGWPLRSRGDGEWIVPISSRFQYQLVLAGCLTKLPREEALTLRFVGSKVGLNNVLVEAEKEATRMRVRVERVEEAPDDR